MVIDKATVAAFYDIVSKGERFVIIGHINPDGDCIGSTTGMRNWLELSLGKKNVNIVVPNEFPNFLNFLDIGGRILAHSAEGAKAESLVKSADVIICMDFNTLKRTEALQSVIAEAKGIKVLIDHHPQPEPFADLTISFTEISSASELTWWLVSDVSENHNLTLPIELCTSLYTGMMTDTNNFNNSVFSSTFMMASQLQQRGVEREKIQFAVFNNYSEDRMRLMGYLLLNKLRVFQDLNASIMVLSRQEQKRFNYRDGDSEGFVNLALSIADVEVASLFTETDEYIKVSLRSKGRLSVNSLSRAYFNGAGHERASGGRLYIPVEQVEGYFEESLRSFLASNK